MAGRSVRRFPDLDQMARPLGDAHVVSAFPSWSYFPSNSRPPDWVHDLVGVFGAAQHLISTAAGAGLKSDEVLSHLVEGLHAMRFVVETGKSTAQKIRRPVLFGEQGAPKLSMDIDAFHDEFGIVLEVEAGRAWNGNAVYRDLIRSSLILDASYLALAVPVGYAPEYAARPIPAYGNTRGVLEAIYASQRLKLPFAGVLLIGY